MYQLTLQTYLNRLFIPPIFLMKLFTNQLWVTFCPGVRRLTTYGGASRWLKFQCLGAASREFVKIGEVPRKRPSAAAELQENGLRFGGRFTSHRNLCFFFLFFHHQISVWSWTMLNFIRLFIFWPWADQNLDDSVVLLSSQPLVAAGCCEFAAATLFGLDAIHGKTPGTTEGFPYRSQEKLWWLQSYFSFQFSHFSMISWMRWWATQIFRPGNHDKWLDLAHWDGPVGTCGQESIFQDAASKPQKEGRFQGRFRAW